MELDPLTGGAVFLAAFGINYFGTLAVRRAAEGNALQAANYESGITALNGFLLFAFTKVSTMSIIPELAGVWMGTYGAVSVDVKAKRLNLRFNVRNFSEFRQDIRLFLTNRPREVPPTKAESPSIGTQYIVADYDETDKNYLLLRTPED